MELRLRAALHDECVRQRNVLSEMETTDAHVETLDRILVELLSHTKFVAVLKVAGIVTIPCLVQRCLLEPSHSPVFAVTSESKSGTACGEQDGRMHVPDNASDVFSGDIYPVRTTKALAQMVPSRQRAVTAVMRSAHNFAGDFACALLAATPASKRADVVQGWQPDFQRMRKFARLEKQLVRLHVRSRILSGTHGNNLVRLAVYTSFVRSWTRSSGVLAWLSTGHQDQLAALERIVATSDFAKEPRRPMKLPYATHSHPGQKSRR